MEECGGAAQDYLITEQKGVASEMVPVIHAARKGLWAISRAAAMTGPNC